MHEPDLDLSAQRPREIRVSLPQQQDGAGVDSAQRPSQAATPTQILIGDQQPASARGVGRMSSGIHVQINTKDKAGQVRWGSSGMCISAAGARRQAMG